ncbi:hypothetical protein COL26b_013287 [Colletotrichum chrysophilum]|uniref:uncharacterized protein n=1 Tax=Colletotrichum chrysophilum TaxID=1836956 RepID=UPI0022FFD967|nr:uncharacterized protein COL26b_013287 [Colletotrichum chrysophilum]KAJ0362583.1 hypothetical protein COL26b_013287 [Colletotrichum chrysophilum]
MSLVQAMGMHCRAVTTIRNQSKTHNEDIDVAARTTQASIQHDADMDHDLPPTEDEVAMAVAPDVGDASADDDLDDFNYAACARGMTKLNLFHARVELAQIQGRYNCAFSLRARYMNPGEKAQFAQGIRLSIQ